MAQTRIDTYQIEPGTNGQHLVTVGGVATWTDNVDLGVPSAAIVENEVPTGTINGSNTAFTLANVAQDASFVKLYLDGVRLKEGAGNDFTFAGGSAITMLYAPATGQNFLVDYIKTY